MPERITNSRDGKLPTEKDQARVLEPLAHDDGTPTNHIQIAILGTGFSGLGMAIRLKQRGYHDFIVLEKADDIGGTWRDNTYPGCACDIPSHLYSFSFAPNPDWTRVYPSQPEIRAYLRSCAERFGILPHIRWQSELLDASWHAEEQRWHLTTTRGHITAQFFITGHGALSEPALPSIPGLDTFAGALFHSAQWRHDYDLTGKHVAVIGTGASAVQFVPHIQPLVGKLSLFLRTPPWILPRLDHEIPEHKRALYRKRPFKQRLARYKIYWRNELSALGLIYRPQLLKTAIQIAQRHLEQQVPDPALRAKLVPRYTMGCKRILLSDDFYPALTQPNVEVISERIREVRPHSIITDDGQEHEVDTIICGTGFHVTDMHMPLCIHGRGGQSLSDKWRAGLRAYLGTTVTDFPNLFLMIGPNTGLGHNSMVFMIEAQITYILDCLRTIQRRKATVVEVQASALEHYAAEMQRRMQGTVWTSGCASWYLDPRGHNTTLWPGFTFEFWRRTRHFDPHHYHLLTPKQAPAPPVLAT